MPIDITPHRTNANYDGSGGFWLDDRAGRFADAIIRRFAVLALRGDWSADVYVDISGQEASASAYVTVDCTRFCGAGQATYKVRISDHDLPIKYHAQDSDVAVLVEVRHGDGTQPASVAARLAQALLDADQLPAETGR